MKTAEIKFVRVYPSFGKNCLPMYDVVYASGRCITKGFEDMSRPVKQFIATSKIVTKQFDTTFNREELIYE